MITLSKVLQSLVAAGGFFTGYLWAVLRWAGGAGERPAAVLVEASLPAGFCLAGVYALLFAGLFWPWIPHPRAVGLRVVVSPVAFTLSFLLGAFGLQTSLRLVAG